MNRDPAAGNNRRAEIILKASSAAHHEVRPRAFPGAAPAYGDPELMESEEALIRLRESWKKVFETTLASLGFLFLLFLCFLWLCSL